MALITYPNKITGDLFTAEEATEIKTVVNSNHNGVMAAIDDAVADALEAGPISEAIAVVQNDIDAHEALINNPHSVTKAQVGLSNVDNTADSAKPVSTAQQTALDLKANISNPTFTTGITTPLIKITSGSPGLGKVLTSDADGDALWATPSAGTTIDTIPTDGSSNAVASNGVFDALALKISIANLVWNEIPTGTINGDNLIFTVANTPISALVVADAMVLTPDVDYTLVGATLTFSNAPISQVLIFYLK